MKLPMLDNLYEQMMEVTPEIVKLFAPRRYVPPQGYANPRDYAPLGAVLCGMRNDYTSIKTMIDCRVNAYNLVRYQVPTYFVAHEFGAAVMATTPPSGLTIGDLVWPMPAILFVIPQSLSLAIFNRHIPFVSISRLPTGECCPPDDMAALIPNCRGVRYEKEVGGAVLHGILYQAGQTVDYSMATSDHRLLSDVCKDDRFAEEYYGDPVSEKVAVELGLTEEEDVTIINKMTSLAFGLLLAMAARPETVESHSVARPQKVKRGVEVLSELWRPNMIGRHYRAVREVGDGQGGTHATPRMHWRRGHYRNQFFGKDRAGRRLIWVEPMLVNAEAEVAK